MNNNANEANDLQTDEKQSSMRIITEMLLNSFIPGFGRVDGVFIMLAGEGGSAGQCGKIQAISPTSNLVVDTVSEAATGSTRCEQFKAAMDKAMDAEGCRYERA